MAIGQSGDSFSNSSTNTIGAVIGKDAASDHRAHISHFGVLKAGPTIPVLKGNFQGTSLDSKLWREVTLNSASSTVADGMVRMQSGTNSAGSIKLESVRQGRFEAGQVTVFQSGVRVGTGLANNIRIWGLMKEDEQEGIYFKWNGTTFQVVVRKGGTETAVDQANFNGDSSFSPADTNATYRIEYSAGRAIFYSASGGKKNLLHEMVDTAEPLVNDLDLGVYYENTNSGNTTDVSMYIRGSSVSVWGSLDRYNDGGAHLVSDFGTEVALDNVSNYSIVDKFGRNPDIGTATTPEDIWNGGSNYTGFNATSNENIEVFSSDANDQGSEVSSGTATSGGFTTITDSGADFVSDGVAVGDILVNDTKSAHGAIITVSATTLTVHRMIGDSSTIKSRNDEGDSYRVVNANDTGAALIKLSQLLDQDYVSQPSQYVILNGVTGVTVTGNYIRCTRAQVILAGSSGHNEGIVTIRQATTTANVFANLPAEKNQTTIAAYTVASNQIGLITRVRVSITRASGAAGSANIDILIRRFGEVFRAVRSLEIGTGAGTSINFEGGLAVPPCSDIKFRVASVSDNNTLAEAAFDVLLLGI